MDPPHRSLTLAPPPSRPDEQEENNALELDLTLGHGRTVPPPQSSPSRSAADPTVEEDKPLRFQPNTTEDVISFPFSVPPPPSSAERSSLLAPTSRATSPMVPTTVVNRDGLPPRLSCSPRPSSAVPSSSQETTSLRALDLLGSATSRPSPRTYTTAPASVDRCNLFDTVQKHPSPLSPMRIQNFEPGSSSRATNPCVLALWPPLFRPNELEENNEPEPDPLLPRQSSPSLSTVQTVEGEKPLRVQPNTPEEVISSPFSFPPTLSSAERSSLLAPTSPGTSQMLPTTTVNRHSLPPHLSCSPRPSSVVPSSSQEVTSLRVSDLFGRATSRPSPTITYTTTSDPLSTAVRIKTPTPRSSPVESQKDCSALVHTAEPQPLSWVPSPRPSSAVPNSAKESASSPDFVDPCNLFQRATPRPSQITDTTASDPLLTDVRTVQKLPQISTGQIQEFDLGSSSRATDLRVLAPCARNSPPRKKHCTSTSGHSTTTLTESPQPIVRLPPPGPPPEVPVPPPAIVQGAADIRGFIIETKNALLARGIRKISGDIKCNVCKNQSIIYLDLPEDLTEMANFIINNKRIMERGNCMTTWYYPNLLNCPKCGAISKSRPVLEGSVNHISWLFLFLGKLLGFCSQEQLYSYHASVLPGCKKKVSKDQRLFSVFSHILGLLDPGRCPTALPRSIPPASATPTISRASPNDFGSDSPGREENPR